jgi:hypothetical protein
MQNSGLLLFQFDESWVPWVFIQCDAVTIKLFAIYKGGAGNGFLQLCDMRPI